MKEKNTGGYGLEGLRGEPALGSWRQLRSFLRSCSNRSMSHCVESRSMSAPIRSQKYFNCARWSRVITETSLTSSVGCAGLAGFVMAADSIVAAVIPASIARYFSIDNNKTGANINVIDTISDTEPTGAMI